MGTLTGNTPALSEHCLHKLPSSCRLTALPICCACQDTRPHSVSGFYPVYIDGVGVVTRGARWQRYCFFCKEFWANRLAATDPPIEPNHTRIPEIPDQSEFLDKWFDYHRGYKITKGVTEEQKIEMKPEIPWREVDPGTLPVRDDVDRLARIKHVPVLIREQQGPSESIESALDTLLGEAEGEEAVSDGRSVQAVQPPPIPTNPTRRGPTEADQLAAQRAKEKLEEVDRVLADAHALHQRLVQELATAEDQLKERQNERRIALQENRGAQQLLRVLNLQGRSTDSDAQRFARVWGTMEDIRAHGSPLTNMFNNAYARYQVAEEVRAEERASVEMTERQRELLARLGPWSNRITDADYATELDVPLQPGEKHQTLDDEDSNRPPPKTDEEMTVPLICKICLQQPANMAVLPCGHLTMCRFLTFAQRLIKRLISF